MKIFYLLFWTCVLQQFDSNCGQEILVIRPLPDCISAIKFKKVSKILCENRTNATLWQQIIDCHATIAEEFLRKSGAANCPVPQLVDPTDTSNSIQEVFLNFCNFSEGSFLNIFKGEHCYMYGRQIGSLTILPHKHELAHAKQIYGADVNCNIGKCISDMVLD